MNRKIIRDYLKKEAGKDFDIMMKFGEVAAEAVELENMSKASVNGVECVVYGYEVVDGLPIARVRFEGFQTIVPVAQSLIEVRA